MKTCHSCHRKLPRWFFKNVPKGWYSRDGKQHCCKLCNFKKPIRYKRVKKKMFHVLEPYEVSIWWRIKDLFR